VDDIVIPGDELERLASLLPSIEALLGPENRAGAGDGVDAGSSDLSGAIANFEARWSGGRERVGEDARVLRAGARRIVDRFTRADQDVARALAGRA
jgi:hypothetical protein